MLYSIATPERIPEATRGPAFSVPMYLQVEITSRCNLKCKMCPLTLGTTASSGSGGVLADSDWDQVKRLSTAAGRVMLVGFGEPMTHPGFVGILEELDKLGVEISFSTNGIGAELIAPRLTALKRLRHVNISIDSPDPEQYADIRGGDLNRALQGMRAIANAVPDRVNVTVNSVVMKRNVRSLKAFPSILQDAGIRFYALNGLHDYEGELRDEHIHTGRALQTFLPRRRMHTVLDELKEECVRHDVQLLLNHRTQLDFYKPEQSAEEYFGGESGADRKVTRACTVPFDSMYVDSDGKVFSCCHAAGTTPLGDLRKESVEGIWSGGNFTRFRNDLLDARTTPDVCRSCTVAPLGEHPFNLYRAEVLSVEPLATVNGFRLRVKNTGSQRWASEAPLRLAPSRPNDRTSIFSHPSWMSPTRVSGPSEAEVRPGDVATLEFQVTPAHAARPEFFQLLLEGKNWLPDTILEFEMPEAPALEISGIQPGIGAEGMSFDIQVTTNAGVPWVAESDSDWVLLTPAAGVGPALLAVSVLPNWHADERESSIRIGKVKAKIDQRGCTDVAGRVVLLCYWKLMHRAPTANEVERLRTLSDPATLVEALVLSDEFRRNEAAAYTESTAATGKRPDMQGWTAAREKLRAAGGSANPAPDLRHNPRVLTDLLFAAFLEQMPRPGRWRGVIRTEHDTVSATEVIKRFLALNEVQAVLTPTDNSELPS